MKQMIILVLLAFSTLSFTSCMKDYTCSCPAGIEAQVKTISKKDAREACKEASNNLCTL